MVFISSFRPCAPLNSEYHKNQRYAFESWHEATETICYFNSPEPYLESDFTLFIPSNNFPTIFELAELASYQNDWSCIINSDIVIGQGFHHALEFLNRRKAKASVSWRYEFEPAVGLWPNKIVDPGMDWFAARPEIWREIAKHVPEGLKLGCQRWDSWMLGAFNAVCPKHFFSVTRHRFVLHPRHGDRKYGGEVGDIKPLGQDHWPPEI